MIQWDESYSVRVEEIDTQHRQLFESVNRFEEAVEQEAGPEALLDLLDFLLGYAERHFATEEKYFERFGYELADSHCRQHEAFLHNVRLYKERYESGKVVLPVEVTTFLQNWMKEHVITSDQRYVPCFREHGLS